MNAAVESHLPSQTPPSDLQAASWSRGRWLMWIAAVFAAQVGLIIVLSDKKPVEVRQVASTPGVMLTTAQDEMLALNDPTLFVLPHVNGFSGAAWMRLPRVEVAPYQWTEPPQWLPVPVAQLASAISEFLQTNRFERYSPPLKSAPGLTMPQALPPVVLPEAKSTVRVEGALAGRTILNPPSPASQPALDLLASTVVQVMVDGDGRVLSAVLIGAGSGSKEADQSALTTARALHFEPLPAEGAGRGDASYWTRGRLVFQWHTVPLPQTNAPASIP